MKSKTKSPIKKVSKTAPLINDVKSNNLLISEVESLRIYNADI